MKTASSLYFAPLCFFNAIGSSSHLTLSYILSGAKWNASSPSHPISHWWWGAPQPPSSLPIPLLLHNIFNLCKGQPSLTRLSHTSSLSLSPLIIIKTMFSSSYNSSSLSFLLFSPPCHISHRFHRSLYENDEAHALRPTPWNFQRSDYMAF